MSARAATSLGRPHASLPNSHDVDSASAPSACESGQLRLPGAVGGQHLEAAGPGRGGHGDQVDSGRPPAGGTGCRHSPGPPSGCTDPPSRPRTTRRRRRRRPRSGPRVPALPGSRTSAQQTSSRDPVSQASVGDVEEPADRHDALRVDGVGQTGELGGVDGPDLDLRRQGRLEQSGVPVEGLGVDEDRHHRGGGNGLADRLGTFGEKQPGPFTLLATQQSASRRIRLADAPSRSGSWRRRRGAGCGRAPLRPARRRWSGR